MNVRLDLAARLEAAGLLISYAVVNLTEGEIGVFNRIPTVNADGTLRFAAETVYADSEDDMLHLKKMVLPIPDGLQVAGQSVPGVTRLAAGKSAYEEFVLALPVSANNPYRRALLAAQEPGGTEIVPVEARDAHAVALSVGVFAVTPDIRFELFTPAWPDIFMPIPPGLAAEAQSCLSAAVSLPRPIPILEYGAVVREQA